VCSFSFFLLVRLLDDDIFSWNDNNFLSFALPLHVSQVQRGGGAAGGVEIMFSFKMCFGDSHFQITLLLLLLGSQKSRTPCEASTFVFVCAKKLSSLFMALLNE